MRTVRREQQGIAPTPKIILTNEVNIMLTGDAYEDIL